MIRYILSKNQLTQKIKLNQMHDSFQIPTHAKKNLRQLFYQKSNQKYSLLFQKNSNFEKENSFLVSSKKLLSLFKNSKNMLVSDKLCNEKEN